MGLDSGIYAVGFKMSQVNTIRELAKSGYRNNEIVRITSAVVNAVKKYVSMDDLSPKAPITPSHPSNMDSYLHPDIITSE